MGVLADVLRVLSGEEFEDRVASQLLYDKVIGFRGIVDGVGCSTIVQNVAIALASKAKLGIKNVCVLDTHFVYPTQYDLLTNVGAKDTIPDIGSFEEELSTASVKSKYEHIYVFGFWNRTVLNMLSNMDSSATMIKLLEELKKYFDVILVDLSDEPTKMMVEAAIKCNRIYTVADPSIKCVGSIQKSINTLSTLAIPFYKCRKAILNKDIPGVRTNAQDILSQFNFDVLGTIHLSREIAIAGVTGKKLWGRMTTNPDIVEFNTVIDAIVNDILESAIVKTDGVNSEASVGFNGDASASKTALTKRQVREAKAEEKARRKMDKKAKRYKSDDSKPAVVSQSVIAMADEIPSDIGRGLSNAELEQLSMKTVSGTTEVHFHGKESEEKVSDLLKAHRNEISTINDKARVGQSDGAGNLFADDKEEIDL